METVQAESNIKNFLIPTIVVLIIALLVLIFFLSPLKELVFPSPVEPALTLSVVESIGPDAATGFYRIVVKAKAKGKPEPQVIFNRNDGADELEANYVLLLLEEGESFMLKALATNPHGTAEAELELFAGIMVGAVSGRAEADQGGRNGTAAPGEGGEDEEEPPFDREEDEEVPADPGSAEPRRAEPLPPGDPGDDSIDAPAHQITSMLYRNDRKVDGELESNWVDITSLVNRGGDEVITLHDDGMFHVFSLATFDTDDENLWDYINIDFADGNIYHRGVSRINNSISFVWQIRELLAEGRGDFHSSATITLRYPPGTEDIKTIRVFSPAPEPRAEPERRFYSSFEIVPEASLSGYVASCGEVRTGDVVLLGDSDDNCQYKGYLSFVLPDESSTIESLIGEFLPDGVTASDIAEKITVIPESIEIVFSHINISGNPQEMASLVDFKLFDYGDSLDSGDFAVGGRRLFTVDSGQFNTTGGPARFSIDPDVFLAAGPADKIQFKLGLNITTNLNNEADIFQFHIGSVSLVFNHVVVVSIE